MTIATLPIPKAKTRPTTMTVERFERHTGLKGYELVEGHLERKGMGALSSFLNLEIATMLKNFVKQNRIGFAFESECMYRCFPGKPNTIRRPDASFVRNGRFPKNAIPEGIIEIPPDFAVEVMSVHDRRSRVAKKVQEYLDAGVLLVWVIEPSSHTLQAYKPDGSMDRYSGNDIASADPAVPGFTVKLSELFPPVSAN